MFDLAQALFRGTPQECSVEGTVLDIPRTYYGRRSHAEHEYFHVNVDGHRLEVAQNLGIGAEIPVQPGDEIALHGELVPHGSHGPLIHWLHHDPAGRHENGFVIVNGRRYS